jgi:hypothetical protein
MGRVLDITREGKSVPYSSDIGHLDDSADKALGHVGMRDSSYILI